ncbi:hypothetical protein PISMIDRAFT_349479 [Pisolithus microcarpus 441]|uniref:Uncharacterized protein n=1 Tax=Pisolithus microcarpus 441 TaxID=765257 RepID=A0A0C9YK21_9AGAM|nr:hypothetical protein PISMIDRAFT_349479 [Pisolithus microcarpus 441]
MSTLPRYDRCVPPQPQRHLPPIAAQNHQRAARGRNEFLHRWSHTVHHQCLGKDKTEQVHHHPCRSGGAGHSESSTFATESTVACLDHVGIDHDVIDFVDTTEYMNRTRIQATSPQL